MGEMMRRVSGGGGSAADDERAPRQAVPYYDWRFHPNNKSWTFNKGDKTTTRFGRFEDGKFITGKHSCCRYCAICCLMVGFQEILRLPPRGPSFYRALLPLRTPPRRQLARQAAIRSASTKVLSSLLVITVWQLSHPCVAFMPPSSVSLLLEEPQSESAPSLSLSSAASPNNKPTPAATP